jgi:endonuclease/exonuclease/phosphatase (EEP) superfamily protein YafD
VLARFFARLAGLAGLALAAAALAGEAGRAVVALDILNHFRLPLLALGAALLAFALPLRRASRLGRAGLVASLAATLLHGVYVAPEFLRGPPAALAQGEALRLAFFNMHGAMARPEALAAFVHDERIDVLVLAEVGWGGRASVEAVRPMLPFAAIGGPMAILSRHPLAAPAIGYAEVRGSAIVAPAWASATLSPPGHGPLHIVGVHFGWPEPAMEGQGEQIAWVREKLAAANAGRTILMGDFNLTPFSHVFAGLERGLPLRRATHGLPSFPTPHARLGGRVAVPIAFLPIDHIFTGRALAVTFAARGPDLGSDHYPVFVGIPAP